MTYGRARGLHIHTLTIIPCKGRFLDHGVPLSLSLLFMCNFKKIFFITPEKKVLDNWYVIWYNTFMTKEITTRMSPEGLEIANSYLTNGNVEDVSHELKVSKDVVVSMLHKREVRKYIDTVYMDLGYRNRFKLGETLDLLIEKKMEEAEESEIYSNKDIADLLLLAHKIRMDELKAQTELEKTKVGRIRSQTNVQINSELPFGQGNYGKLMDKLLKNKN